MKLILKLKQKHGIALILTILLMTMILFLSLFILNFSITEDKIAKSQAWGAKTYYLAEAGIREMIWKLKNDADYKYNFETNPAWTASFTHNNPFGAGSGTYTVSIVNDAAAHGEITSFSAITIGNGKSSQRTIKTKVYRLIGESGMGTNSVMNGGGTINILNSDRVEIVGDTYSNSAIVMQGSHPDVSIDGNLTTVSTITEGNGELGVTGTTQDEDSVPPPTPALIPGVDFSYLQSLATTVLNDDTQLNAGSPLNGVIFVNRYADITNNLTINGLLVVNGNLNITNSAAITINHTSGSPSGIIVNGNIKIGETDAYNADITINGVIYSTGSLTLEKLISGYTFTATGGVASGNGILIKNCSRNIQIIYSSEILDSSLISSSNSPVMVIEHWEEEY